MSAGVRFAAPTPPEAGAGFERMSGPQRAAALLLLLGEAEGAAIWQRLDEDEVKKVSQAMAGLGSLEAGVVERLVVDFVERLTPGGLTANLERTEALLAKVFPPERVAAILAEIRGDPGRRVWAGLPGVDPGALAAFLRGEYPQTAAVVLSKVRPDYAAKVLTLLPEAFAEDVLARMLRLDAVQPGALRRIEEALRQAFVATVAKPARRDPHERIADVFNAFDRQTEARFLAALERTDGDAAQRIRDLMFTFEDLLKLDPGSVQTLMRSLDNATLCRALKGAEARVLGFFTSQMSTRAAKNFTDELESLGPIRLKEVEEAQSRMTELARELAEKGEIMIAKSTGAAEDLVY